MNCLTALPYRISLVVSESGRRQPVEALTYETASAVSQRLGRLTPCRSLSVLCVRQ